MIGMVTKTQPQSYNPSQDRIEQRSKKKQSLFSLKGATRDFSRKKNPFDQLESQPNI